MKIFTMSLLLTVAVVPSASASPSQSPSQVLEEATQVATDYFKSYISKDIEGRTKNSVEPIYSNDTERRAAHSSKSARFLGYDMRISHDADTTKNQESSFLL